MRSKFWISKLHYNDVWGWLNFTHLVWESNGLLGKALQSEAVDFCLVLRNNNTVWQTVTSQQYEWQIEALIVFDIYCCIIATYWAWNPKPFLCCILIVIRKLICKNGAVALKKWYHLHKKETSCLHSFQNLRSIPGQKHGRRFFCCCCFCVFIY